MGLSELRRDYLLDRFVVVPTENGNGHGNGNGNGNGHNHSNGNGNGAHRRNGRCLYCPGNEHLTSPAVLAMVQKDGMYQMLSDDEGNYVKDWCVRVFPSNDPAVSTAPNVAYGEQPLYREPAYGFHYVLVAADHKQKLSDMPIEQWANVLLVIQDRVKWLYAQKRVNYVSIFAGYGKSAGSNGEHSQINLVTFPTIPPTIMQEAEASERFADDSGSCPMCDIARVEASGPREVLSTQNFVAVCPWAPTYPYEFWIVPKRHSPNFSSVTQMEINDLALMIRSTLGGLASSLKDTYFNMAFHLSPERKNNVMIHWHIEVYPQTSNWSGFERAFGVYMNNVSPEHAAEVLKPSCRKELAAAVGVK